MVQYPLREDELAETTSWFVNSYYNIMNLAETREISDPDLIDKLYEEIYNVKLIINNVEWVNKVEFTSPEDAAFFIIKWA